MDYREARIETVTLVAQAGNGGGLEDAAQEMEVATLGLQCEGCINRTC